MNVGLEGNVVTCNYGTLGFFAEHSWRKHTWHLCYLFDCEVVIDSDYMPQNPREVDRVIMELFINAQAIEVFDVDAHNSVLFV